ncbi:MAG TPA: hypothetical protein VMD25_01340 [Acidobacteriaceae bacterium]|nr:hypothetical protein [Acidobacteriaceae bacterium]
MLPECRYIYPDGHRCGRIPRHGQPHCPAHSRPQPIAAPNPAPAAPASDPDDPAFVREMRAWSAECARMHFHDLLLALARALCPIEIHILARPNPHNRIMFARAAIALGIVTERIVAAPSEPIPLSVPGPLARLADGELSNLIVKSFLNRPK